MAKPTISPLSLNILLLFFIVALSSVQSQAAPGGRGREGGIQKIPDVKTNKEVQDLGRFCVQEYNKKHNLTNGSKDALVFIQVVEGEQQVVSGMKYYLTIAAAVAGHGRYYRAVLVDQPWIPKRDLLSFTPLLTKRGGGKETIPNVKENKYVQEVGKYAVEEYNKQHNLTNGKKGAIVFTAVVKGEQQIVAGVMYYLMISGTVDGTPQSFDAVVLDQPWIPNRELRNFSSSIRRSAEGGKVPIPDVEKNKEVQALGKYAVEAYNKQHNSTLIFSKVVEAERQVVAGFKYYLKLTAAPTPHSGLLKTFDAVVLVKPGPGYKKELLSFKPSPHA